MKASEAELSGVLGTALVEALQCIAEPGIAHGIVQAVLRRGGLAAVPEDVEDFRDFVEGPMRTSVTRWLGEEAGASMVEQLRPTIDMASSHVRSSSGERPVLSPLARVSVRPQALPTVVLMSYDEPIAATVAEELDGRAHVRMVEMTMQLISAAETRGRPPILVIDDGASTIDAETVAWLTSLVSGMPPVLLWGVDIERHGTISRAVPAAASWRRVEARRTDCLVSLIDELIRWPAS